MAIERQFVIPPASQPDSAGNTVPSAEVDPAAKSDDERLKAHLRDVFAKLAEYIAEK